VIIHYTDDEAQETPEVLDEYKNLVNKNKKLIGWLKIDDTNIDYPVMQTSDNEYYLEHNLNQEYDKNGSIFMDKDCDVLKPSTNLIIYGHHMKSGKMFGELDKYSDFQYYQDHRYIDFDTIYEKGIYEVMYVFRSRVYSEQEVVFKYYQFIDAQSEVEFNSNMNEMASASLYDTGVTASYGDRLLTLSTCDYQEKNGRFVVVAKKVLEKE
jgi:sortase B